MKKFIKKEWFKIIIIILLGVVVISYASSQYVYYQKQQIQLQEMRQEQDAKEKLYPTFLKIQELKKEDISKAHEMYHSLSAEEKKVYQSIKGN